MNIFFLCLCVKKCAKYHFDKHVVKMILELCQLLSCAWHVLDEDDAELLENDGIIYKSTHINHPCAVWVRKHINNYNYVVDLALELCNEWRFRYNHPLSHKHKCETMLLFLRDNAPFSIPKFEIDKSDVNPLRFVLPLPQAMPEELKYKPHEKNVYNGITAYQNYYMSSSKSHLVSWTQYDEKTKTRISLNQPKWFVKNVENIEVNEMRCTSIKNNGERCSNKVKKDGKCGVHLK